MWPFKHCQSGAIEAVNKVYAALPIDTFKAREGCLSSYSAIVNYLLKPYAMDDDIAIVDVNIRTYKKQDMTATDFAR